MHAWENIGRCINFIQKTYHTDKHTASGTAKIRSQMLSVRIYIRDQQKQCHTYTQSPEILIIFFFARAEYRKINHCSDQEKVPEYIWNNKIRAKRNLIIS